MAQPKTSLNCDPCILTVKQKHITRIITEIITDRADIYSLGCVIYEMLTLSVPHMPPLSMYGEDDSMLEQTFDEDEFL